MFFLVNFAGYSKSWDVCSQLGQSEGFQDLATRQELMAFALTHCPPGSIEPLLAASSSLQTEVSAPSIADLNCVKGVLLGDGEKRGGGVDLRFLIILRNNISILIYRRKIACYSCEKEFEALRV